MLDEENYIIKWDKESARFCLEGDTIATDSDYAHGSECEIIGNIFDNSEMLH